METPGHREEAMSELSSLLSKKGKSDEKSQIQLLAGCDRHEGRGQNNKSCFLRIRLYTQHLIYKVNSAGSQS